LLKFTYRTAVPRAAWRQINEQKLETVKNWRNESRRLSFPSRYWAINGRWAASANRMCAVLQHRPESVRLVTLLRLLMDRQTGEQ